MSKEKGDRLNTRIAFIIKIPPSLLHVSSLETCFCCSTLETAPKPKMCSRFRCRQCCHVGGVITRDSELATFSASQLGKL